MSCCLLQTAADLGLWSPGKSEWRLTSNMWLLHIAGFFYGFIHGIPYNCNGGCVYNTASSAPNGPGKTPHFMDILREVPAT